MKRILLASTILLLAVGFLFSQLGRRWPGAKTAPGPTGDGAYLLTTGWKIRPAGRQVPLTTLPLTARFTTDQKSILIIQSGFLTPTLSLHDRESGQQRSSVELKD